MDQIQQSVHQLTYGKTKPCRAANVFMLSNKSSGYASVSFGMIAIVPMPIARRRRTHR